MKYKSASVLIGIIAFLCIVLAAYELEPREYARSTALTAFLIIVAWLVRVSFNRRQGQINIEHAKQKEPIKIYKYKIRTSVLLAIGLASIIVSFVWLFGGMYVDNKDKYNIYLIFWPFCVIFTFGIALVMLPLIIWWTNFVNSRR